MAEYTPAPTVRRIADDLILDHHRHLIGQPVRYVFRSEAAKSKGRLVWGKARKLSGLNAFLASDVTEDEIVDPDVSHDFFVIEIAKDVWDNLDQGQRQALVDHELCHCDVTETEQGETKLVVRGHDLEEFRGVVRRNGLWKDDVRGFADAVQMTLGDVA